MKIALEPNIIAEIREIVIKIDIPDDVTDWETSVVVG